MALKYHVKYVFIRGKQNGTSVIGYQYHGGNNQRWKLQKVDTSTVWPTWVIRNVETNTNLDLYNGGKENKTKITGWAGAEAENSNPHQLWYLVTADDEGRVFMIQNVGTGTYVDLFNGNSANSTQITGWAGQVERKNPHQLWRILHC
ncbi:carbohydrate-binding module family 13 protein [Annulohypoxylon bovei var. microspora]|nr:carbohydrate-binding module family 13 protein [Annulohypoxylon bovei var. microspora]